MPLPDFIKGSGKGIHQHNDENGKGKGKGKGKGYDAQYPTVQAHKFDPTRLICNDDNISYNSTNNSLYCKLTHMDESIKGVSIVMPPLVSENSLQMVKDRYNQVVVKSYTDKYTSDCYLQLRITPYHGEKTDQNINLINKYIASFNNFHDNFKKDLKSKLYSVMKQINRKKFLKNDDNPNADINEKDKYIHLLKKDMDMLRYIPPSFTKKVFTKQQEEYDLEFFKPIFMYEEGKSSTNSENYDGTGKYNVFFRKDKVKFNEQSSTFDPQIDIKGFMVSAIIQIQGFWINLTNKTYGLKIKAKTFTVEPKLLPKYIQLDTIAMTNSIEAISDSTSSESNPDTKEEENQNLNDISNESESDEDDW